MTPRRAKNTNRQGANFELQIMHDLESYGYTTMRSSGSHGAVDVVAFADGEILLIQAKISQPVIPPRERKAVLRLADMLPEHAVPLVSYRIKGKVMYRLLTGPGPKDFRLWAPEVLPTAVCECGHVHAEHAEDGCWSGGYKCLCTGFAQLS